jgi:hypothetical protein
MLAGHEAAIRNSTAKLWANTKGTKATKENPPWVNLSATVLFPEHGRSEPVRKKLKLLKV